MARPKKIGLDYFPVDVSFNEQVQALESVHGNDGLVWLLKFWQSAYKTEFGEVDLKGLFGSISANNARTTPEQQTNIIRDCLQLGLLIEISPGVYSSNGIKKRIASVSKDRLEALNRRKNALFGEQSPNNPQTMRESKVKERKEKENKEKESKEKSVRFAPPTLDDIRAYCFERNNGIDAEKFFSFYESNGWRVGRNPMKSWKAAIVTWEKGDKKPVANKSNFGPQPLTRDLLERQYALIAAKEVPCDK